MIKNFVFAGALFLSLGIWAAKAQIPAEGINYQAVARNAQGSIINSPINVRISIHTGSPSGPLAYQETHATTPNASGIFNIVIGQGTFVSGNVNSFSLIDWGSASHFAKTEINTGSGFVEMGSSQLWAVPYALYAKNVAGGGSGTPYSAGSGINISNNVISAADNSPNNEIQSLSLSGNVLSISGANSVNLPSGSGGGSLDQAYDFGGAGAGRIITADSGPVTINASGSGAGNIGLLVSHNGTGTAGIGVNFGGTGNGIQAISSNPANTFATVQASTNSSTVNNSAVFGQSTGSARAVAGQVESSATADVAVRGLNLRNNGGLGVEGVGFNGVSGSSNFAGGFGVFGTNTATNANGNAGSLGVGTYGNGFNGVYGQTTNVSLGWSGFFTADLGVEGTGFSMGGWQTVSDRRLKTNVVPIPNAMDKLMSLNGMYYTITTRQSGTATLDGKPGEPVEQTKQQYGVIAQDVEAVFPEMVKEKAVFINQGDETVYKTVDYMQLVPVLIEAMKELKAETEALKAEIEELKAQIKK